jgi:hypothetical protein
VAWQRISTSDRGKPSNQNSSSFHDPNKENKWNLGIIALKLKEQSMRTPNGLWKGRASHVLSIATAESRFKEIRLRRI